MLKRIEKIFVTSFLLIILSACATSNDMKKPFDPKDFAEKQESIINDTASLKDAPECIAFCTAMIKEVC